MKTDRNKCAQEKKREKMKKKIRKQERIETGN